MEGMGKRKEGKKGEKKERKKERTKEGEGDGGNDSRWDDAGQQGIPFHGERHHPMRFKTLAKTTSFCSKIHF